MTYTQLKEQAVDTLDWAKELSEVWVGTTTGKIIDQKADQLDNAIKNRSIRLVQDLMIDLGETCHFAGKEIDGY